MTATLADTLTDFQRGADEQGLFNYDGPETQKEAARKVKTGRQRERVLAALVDAGEHGMTDQEMQDFLGVQQGSQNARRKELQRDSLVMDSLTTRERNGMNVMVWVARQFASDKAMEAHLVWLEKDQRKQAIREILKKGCCPHCGTVLP